MNVVYVVYVVRTGLTPRAKERQGLKKHGNPQILLLHTPYQRSQHTQSTVEGCTLDPMPASHFLSLPSNLTLAQYTDGLLLAEATPFHRPSTERRRIYLNSAEFSGSTPNFTGGAAPKIFSSSSSNSRIRSQPAQNHPMEVTTATLAITPYTI
jgi:hypothetical protein